MHWRPALVKELKEASQKVNNWQDLLFPWQSVRLLLIWLYLLLGQISYAGLSRGELDLSCKRCLICWYGRGLDQGINPSVPFFSLEQEIKGVASDSTNECCNMHNDDRPTWWLIHFVYNTVKHLIGYCQVRRNTFSHGECLLFLLLLSDFNATYSLR